MDDDSIISPISLVYFLGNTTIFLVLSLMLHVDKIIFIIALSFALIATCFDINLIKMAENCDRVLKEKLILYQIIDSKKDNLSSVINNILMSKIINILIYILDEKIHFNYDDIKYKIENNNLIEDLSNKGISRKKIKKIKSLLKTNKDDIEELVRQYETKELINKKNLNYWASFSAVLCFILSIYGFFNINYQSINISNNFVVIIIIFLFSIIESICRYRKLQGDNIDYYKKLQQIFEKETLINH